MSLIKLLLMAAVADKPAGWVERAQLIIENVRNSVILNQKVNPLKLLFSMKKATLVQMYIHCTCTLSQ